MQKQRIRRIKVANERGIYYRQTPRGRRYEIYYADSDGKQRWKVIPGFDNLGAARQARAAIVDKLGRGERVAPEKRTLAEAADEWLQAQEGRLRARMTITNGSDDKISNVEFGIRWNVGGERLAAHVPALNPGESHTAAASDVIDPVAFEPQDFEEVWLTRLAFFVRFTDQRGARWENVLDHKTDPRWKSRRL